MNIAADNGNPNWMTGQVPPYGAHDHARETTPERMIPKDEARNLRAEAYNVDGRMRLPIDPYAIASNLGIHVRTTPLAADTAGFIIKEQDEDRPTIYLNSWDGEQRRRFTLSHELGHFVMHRNEPVLAYVDKRDELASKGTDPAERWCNAFAAELLTRVFHGK